MASDVAKTVCSTADVHHNDPLWVDARASSGTNTGGYQVQELKRSWTSMTKESAMTSKSGQRKVWLAIVVSLGLIWTGAAGGAEESTLPPASTVGQDLSAQLNQEAKPLKGSPELWKFRRLTAR